jgi:hypothetical protein
MLAGHSAALSGCSSCKPPTTVEEAQSDLAREIQTKPLRFLVNRAPKEVKITPLPAGTDLESQGGWFFKVEIYSDEGIKKLYVATLGCSRLNVSIDTL